MKKRFDRSIALASIGDANRCWRELYWIQRSVFELNDEQVWATCGVEMFTSLEMLQEDREFEGLERYLDLTDGRFPFLEVGINYIEVDGGLERIELLKEQFCLRSHLPGRQQDVRELGETLPQFDALQNLPELWELRQATFSFVCDALCRTVSVKPFGFCIDATGGVTAVAGNDETLTGDSAQESLWHGFQGMARRGELTAATVAVVNTRAKTPNLKLTFEHKLGIAFSAVYPLDLPSATPASIQPWAATTAPEALRIFLDSATR